jgi:hypothetical protein
MSIALALAYSVLLATGPVTLPRVNEHTPATSLCVAQLATVRGGAVRIVSAEERLVETADSCFGQPGVVLLVQREPAPSGYAYNLKLALGDAVPMNSFVKLVVSALSSVSQLLEHGLLERSDVPRTAFGWSVPSQSVLFPFSYGDLFFALATDGWVRDDVYLIGVPLAVPPADVRRLMPFLAERGGLALSLLEDVSHTVLPLHSFVHVLVRAANVIHAFGDEPAEAEESEEEWIEESGGEEEPWDETNEWNGEEFDVRQEEWWRERDEEFFDERDWGGGLPRIEEVEDDDQGEGKEEEKEDRSSPELRGMRPRRRPTGLRGPDLIPILEIKLDVKEEDEDEFSAKKFGEFFFG